jgi:hypothetical protein
MTRGMSEDSKPSCCSRGLRALDIFGHPIMLKYKRESQYQTEIGGFFTVIVVMGLLGYFSYMLISTVNRTTFTVSNFVEKSDVA